MVRRLRLQAVKQRLPGIRSRRLKYRIEPIANRSSHAESLISDGRRMAGIGRHAPFLAL
jgi:hypothetical protein